MNDDEACLCMDYAESYQCRFQGEVQSAFFEQNTVTIHTMMAYYSQEINGKTVPVKHAIIGITDDQQKDSGGVRAFEDAAIDIIQKQKGRKLEKLHEFTDGCACQYKGKKAFYDIAQRKSPQVTRNFHETSHGKSVCDGLGAVVKSSCYHAILSGREIIRDANDMMAYCEKKLSCEKKVTLPDATEYISRREFVFIKADDVDRSRPDIKTLPGTRKLHSIRSTGIEMKVQYRSISCYCPSCQGEAGPS